jgi:ubiquitin-activating enzyme E1
LSELIATISRKPVPEHAKNLIVEITCEDADDEDVEVPFVMVKLGR